MNNENKSNDHAAHRASGAAMDRRITRKYPVWVGRVGIAVAALSLAAATFITLWPEDGRRLYLGVDRVSVAEVEQGLFEDFIPVRSRVAPRRTVFLDAVEGGRVESIAVEDGAAVEAGQVLVRLSNAQLQLDVIARESEVTQQINNLNTLQLSLEQNRLSHERTLVELAHQIRQLSRRVDDGETLISKGFFSERELEDATDELDYLKQLKSVTLEAQATDTRLMEAQRAQLEEATRQLRQNLALARQNLQNLEVRAPVSGKLTAFDIELGQSLGRGERIGRIDDPEQFKLTALIDEFYLPRVDLEQTASVEHDGDTYLLRVGKIYPQVSAGQFEVDLFFNEQSPSGIRRGQTLQTRLELGSALPAVLIPNGAFYQDTGGQWLFVVSPDNTEAVRRDVRLGRRNARTIEVLEGLEVGERVVVSPYTSFLQADRIVFNQ